MSEVTSVNGKTGAVVLKASDVEAVATSEVGQPSGVASLNGGGVLPEAQLPKSVVSSSAMYANVWNYGPTGQREYALLAGGKAKLGENVATELSAVFSTLAAAQAVYPSATALTQTVDYCAIVAACKALEAAGGTVFIPIGEYIMSGYFTLPYRVSLEGMGGRWSNGENHLERETILRLQAGANSDMLRNSLTGPVYEPKQTPERFLQQSRIAKITFDGNKGGQAGWEAKTSILRLENCWTVDLDEVCIVDGAGHGLYENECNVIRVTKLTSLNSTLSQIYVKKSSDTQMTDLSAGGGHESTLVLDNLEGSQFAGKIYNALPGKTELSEEISSVATTIKVASASTFLTPNAVIEIGTEKVLVKSHNATELLECTRGYEGTTAAIHATKSKVLEITPSKVASAVLLINGTHSCIVAGQWNESHYAVYIENGCTFNYINGTPYEWGFEGLTAFPGIFCDGQNNTFACPLRKPVIGGNKGEIGLEWGTHAAENLFVGTIDPTIAIPEVDNSTARNNTVYNGGANAGSNTQNGVWAIPNAGYAFGTGVASTKTRKAVKFQVNRYRRITKLGIVVTNASTKNDLIDIGITDSTGKRLVHTGMVAGHVNSLGVVKIELPEPIVLKPNVDYYVQLGYEIVEAGTAATLLNVTCSQAAAAAMFGTTSGTLELSQIAAAEIPGKEGITNNDTSTGWAVALLES
jgi:hypothetical protein